MFFQRLSLTWLLICTIILVFVFYSIAAIIAPSTTFKAYNNMNAMATMHESLESQYAQLQSKTASIRHMVQLNVFANKVSLDEVLESASWVDQRITNINLLSNTVINIGFSQTLVKRIRFLMMLAENTEEDRSADDLSSVEEELKSLLKDFHKNVMNQLSSLAINMDDPLKIEKLKNEISGFSVDYDFLFITIENYFKQPINYQDVVRQLFIEQEDNIDNLQVLINSNGSHNYLDIDLLKNLNKQLKFLTMQFYSYSGDVDQQSDSFISLVDNLKYHWEQYEHLLNQQEIRINAIIKKNTEILSSQLKLQTEKLSLLMLLGGILIVIFLIVFFVIAYKRLNILHTTVLNITKNDVLPALMDDCKSNDFVSTIIKAFNAMIISLEQRDNKIQLYMRQLAQHGEYLEEEVQSRTEELLLKNCQLKDEAKIRKENEQQLKLSWLALANTSEAIIITDAENKIIEVNPAFCELTEYSRSESIGQEPSFIHSGEHEHGFYQKLWESLNENGQWEGEIINRRKSGELFPIWETINVVTDDGGDVTNHVGVFRDISKLKEAEDELHSLAYHDHLTQLPNRSLFYEHLEHEITISKRTRSKVAVLFLDLDRFKYVNDTQGHQSGDQLLIEVSSRLKQSVRESDIVARQGGDEFLILLRGIEHIDTVSFISSNIINELKEPFLIEQTEVHIGSSIGISMYPDDGNKVEELIKNSDIAMYYAKQNGKGNYQFFNDSMNANNVERIKLEQRLNVAIENHLFELHFQPQTNQKGNISGAEALLRWYDDELGMIPPDVFIPIAEENGTIHLIGEQVIEMACKAIQNWQEINLIPFTLSINLSPKELLRPDFVANLDKVMNRCQLNPQNLELEITETALVENIDKAKLVLLELNQLGFTIAMDDFGTGYSSLAYLHQLPFDRLKIDRSFISNIPDDHNSCTVAKTIISLAKSMDMTVVAEGVENTLQKNFLSQNDCDYYQGYGISKPLPEQNFIQFVQEYEN
ncbi:MAG: EAL domain-containing protein [Gammaproteobacteria bacterium]|nr:EAL domain-containing protein [Gammaproteobacteria bacterium]